MLAAEAVANPAIWDRLSTSPVNALGALVGVGIWLAMFGIPSWRAMQRLGWILDIEIKDRTVAVRERSLLGTRSWHCPLEQFEGISHHVRTSLSGTRHELVLIHPERERSLLVHMAETISKNETDAFAQRFGLATLSPVCFSSEIRRLACRARGFRQRWSRKVPEANLAKVGLLDESSLSVPTTRHRSDVNHSFV